MGCPDALNYTKFTRASTYSARFCVDPEEEYKLQGNFNNNPTQMIHLKIDRCTAPQVCKSVGEIDRFIKYLDVVTFHQDFNMIINDYDMKPPLDQNLEFTIQQLDPIETSTNFIHLAKNSYELNDVYSGLAPV